MATTKNFAQQGVVITPDPGYNPNPDDLTFNSDKSTVNGKLTIDELAQTHGKTLPELVFNPQFVQAGNTSR